MVKMKNIGDFVLEDENEKVVRDGRKISVAAYMMDSKQAPAADAVQPLRGQPGFATITDADKDRRTKLYADADKKLSERWKNPSTPAPATPSKAAATQTPATDMAALYDKRDRELENRWRNPK